MLKIFLSYVFKKLTERKNTQTSTHHEHTQPADLSISADAKASTICPWIFNHHQHDGVAGKEKRQVKKTAATGGPRRSFRNTLLAKFQTLGEKQERMSEEHATAKPLIDPDGA